MAGGKRSIDTVSDGDAVEAGRPRADEAAPTGTPGAASSPYTRNEEIANSVTHGVGAVLSMIGTAVLVWMAVGTGDGWRLGSSIVYGATLILLYSASTLYHAASPRYRHVFKIIDHSTIYLLIAGTYTPFTLVALRADGGLIMFAVVWSVAIAGIVLEAVWPRRPLWLGLALYLALGWVVVVVARPLVDHVAAGGIAWLVAGGLAYSLGTIFYALKRVRYFHGVWHLFVLAGSVTHFLAVALYVVPLTR